jgi:hypothetical protein
LLLWTANAAIQPAFAKEDVAAAEACQRAGSEAERDLNLPSGLLLAIGLVESGRRDPLTGRIAAWPWTINGDGNGRRFATLAEALATTHALQAGGMTSIDVGCYQINLLHHPTAFANLDEAFDPQANAAYAARFLLALRARTGGWEDAVAAYHSAATERSAPYRDRVLAHWSRDPATPDAVVPHVDRVEVWMSAPVPDQIRIWTPSAFGQAPANIMIQSLSSGPRAALPTVSAGEKMHRRAGVKMHQG